MTLQDSPATPAAEPSSGVVTQPPAPVAAQPSARARRGRGLRRAAVRTGLALVVVAVAGVGLAQRAGDVPLGSLAGIGQLVAAPNSSQNDAIQGVIQRSNAEQAQAIASNDTSVMADTSTPAYLQQMQQVNQDLLANGVTSISLVNVQWGPITVNGSNATVTDYETWQTTYTDGTSEQSRDQNDYQLVLQNGSWLIAADSQPGEAASQPGATAPTAPGAPSAPSSPGTGRTPGDLNSSNNWAGYAATGGDFTAVSGTWTVPQFSATSASGVDATWVGIGGVTSRDLIQAGTQETTTGSGATQYQAWIETLPQASRPVPLQVHAGDSVSVSISQQSNGTWQIAFTDNTTGQNYQTTVQYSSSHSSAEWIEEAPSAGRGGILPLDDFGSINFSNASTVKDGQTDTIAAAGAQPITLVGPSQQPLAVPSALGGDGASFSVTRTQAAATPAAGFGTGNGNGSGSSGFGRQPRGGFGFGQQPQPGFGFGL